MPIYRSTSDKTVSVGRYQVTNDPGVELDVEDAELEALVVSGELTKGEAPPSVEAPKLEESPLPTPPSEE